MTQQCDSWVFSHQNTHMFNKKYIQECYSSPFYNSQMKTSHMSTNSKTDKHMMVRSHNGRLCNTENKRTAIYDTMSDLHRHMIYQRILLI